MKATNQLTLSSNVSTKSPKLATLTALATACAILLSAPVNAAETNAAATSAPSAIDSSKRVIRLAQPKAATTSSDTESVAPQPNRFPMSSAQPQTVRPVTTQPDFTGTTRVYEPGPMTADGIDLSTGQLANVPTPKVQISDISFVPTVLIPQQNGSNSDQLDVSLLDDFIEDVSPNARHYPPNFPNRSQRHYTREKIKVLAEWIEPYALSPNASFDVLIRAAKLNGMGRNLDLGSDYTIRGGKYVDRAIKLQPDSGEANFLYGMMLSEGGGFKEGKKYLDKAVSLGYTEAEQSLAQSDLLSDRRDNALDRLRRLASENPNNAIIPQQIKLAEEGKFYIWDIAAPDINVKPGA
ncbi:MAG: tetratricopeptide repeat protein [Psychrobacter sp.]